MTGILSGILAAGVASLLFMVMSFAPIEAGHVGVLTTWGKVEPSVLSPGFNFKTPISQGVIVYDVRSQRGDIDASAASRDLQTVSAKITLVYRPDASKIFDLHNTLGHDYAQRVIAPTVQEAFKATTAQYTAGELITKREEVKVKATELVRERLEPYFLKVDALNIVNFDFSSDFNAAIEAANVARQQVIQAEQELAKKKVQVETQVLEADAYARATITRANADSEANRLISASLTDRLVTLRTLERWNGTLPTITGGSVPFVSVPTR